MAPVTEYLFQLIARQVEDRQLVVWFDPERVYSDAAANLDLPNTKVVRYSNSFFVLVSQVWRRIGSEPAGEIPSGGSMVKQ